MYLGSFSYFRIVLLSVSSFWALGVSKLLAKQGENKEALSTFHPFCHSIPLCCQVRPILKPEMGSKSKLNISKLRIKKSQRCFNGKCIVISLRDLKLVNSYLIWSCSSLPQHSNYVRTLIIYDASLATMPFLVRGLSNSCELGSIWSWLILYKYVRISY